MQLVPYWAVAAGKRKKSTTGSRMNLRILQNPKGKTWVWGYRGKIQIGPFGQGFCALKGAFLWIGGEEVWCAEQPHGCALKSFFFTLTCRDAKETSQDPRAG